MKNYKSKIMQNGIWIETDEKWNYKDNPINITDWRVVGSSMFDTNGKRPVELIPLEVYPPKLQEKNIYIETLDGDEILGISENKENRGSKVKSTYPSNYAYAKVHTLTIKEGEDPSGKCIFDYFTFSKLQLYIISFESSRLDIAYSDKKISPGTFVILVADRGADCGKIVCVTHIDKYLSLLETYTVNEEITPKEIIRVATSSDLEVFKQKRSLEAEALKSCRLKNNLEMEIVNCEYQWDFKKVTFFYKSIDRVDFRELVKDLYKTFKTRIWMCCVEKSKNWHLKELID